MKQKKWLLPVSIVGGAILLCIVAVVAFGAVMSAKGSGVSKDRLYFAENGTYQIDRDGSLLFAQEVDFDAQYIRTGTRNYEGPFPAVAIIHSADELTAYYEDNKDQFYLERRGDYGSDFTMGYLDACDKYDAKFFENNTLIFIVLEEGSGSTRHSIEMVKVDIYGNMHVDIRSIVPEVGTCDMAYWHIITEVPKDKAPDKVDGVVIHYNGSEYSHSPADEAQDPVPGYCGNTQTTVYFQDGRNHTFMSGNSVAMTDILVNLQYDKNKLCKCLPEYKVDTEFGTGYGINITEGYVRYAEGQADLTQEQIDKLQEIILWAKEEAGSVNANYPDYSFSLTWDVYGISSYDSETGTLIKTKDATNPKDYTTNLKLTPKQYTAIWKLIKGLDIAAYPDNYNPHENGASTPYMTLILSVKADGIDKTVTAEETVLSYETDNAKGQKFLDVCRGIRDILTETDAWKALPEYEFLYD